MRIEKTLEQYYRGQFVHRASTFFDTNTAFFQNALRLHWWSAVHPRTARARRFFTQPVGEIADVLCLSALVSTHMEWIANQVERYRLVLRYFGERSISSRIFVRSRVGRPCAVSPRPSLTANPIRRFPTSSAKTRPLPPCTTQL